MSLEQLAKRLKPVVLESASKLSYHPFRLFLSASDMKERAITRHASAFDPLDAWNAALESLKSSLGHIKPTILRADWVVESQAMTWQDFLKLIGRTRRNYFRKGLALDPNYELAFLETEMNANQMMYKDGKDGNKFCVLRPERCDDYCQRRFNRDFPTPAPGDTVEIFVTEGAFMSDAEKAPLMMTGRDIQAGFRDASHLDDATFLKCARSGALYLAKEVQKSGRFIYGHYPCFDRIVPSYNTLRHFSSIFAMLDVYGTYRMGEATLGAAINRALRYGVKNFIQYRTLEDGSQAAYLVDIGNEIKLGALGVTIVMFAKHSELMKTKKYVPLMEALARGIRSMQNPDGSFVHVLNSEDYSVKEPFRIVYYDGEAIFGLMRLYSLTKDPQLRQISEDAFKRFIATDHWRNHDHWLSYAVNELTRYQPKREYFDFGVSNFLDFLPFIYHRDTQFPTLLELMMAADTMLERMKKMPEVADILARVNLDDFYAAMEARAKNLLSGHFWPELAMFFKRPESIAGSFFIRHQSFRVRTDDVEHFLSSFVAYRRYLARYTTPPKPSEALLKGKAVGTGLFNIDTSKLLPKSDASTDQTPSDQNASDQKPVEKKSDQKPEEGAIQIPSEPIELDENVSIESFVEEFKARDSRLLFMLRSVKPNAAGIEHAVFLRAKLFKQFFGLEPTLLTHEYQNDLVGQLAKYGLDNPILNLYDHFQEIDRASMSAGFAQMPEIASDCQIEYKGSDMRVTRNGRLVMFCVFDPDTQRLSYINYFENGRKIRRDTYDALGFLSRRQTLEPSSGTTLESIYYRPDGSIAIRETFKIVNKKSELTSMELLDRDGQIKRKFAQHQEAIAQWVFELVNNEHLYLIVGDRTPEYTDAYIRLKSEGLSNVRVIHQLHNIHFNLRDGKTRTRHQYLLTDKLRADAILTLTNKQREDILSRYGLKNVVTIPHALKSIGRLERTNYDPLRVVQAGRFVEEKGQAKSLEAFKRVLEKFPQATLHFYGRGELEKDVQAKIDEAGLAQSVIIEGFNDNMPAVFANAGLSLLPSTFEGFALVVQESLQQGCPVVAFDCKYGPSDMIDDGVNGYLVAVDDIDALADRMIRVLGDIRLQQKMSEEAAERIKKFEPIQIAEKWARLFMALMTREEKSA